MSPSFLPPPVSPLVPIPEYLLQVAQAYPDREVVCFLRDAELEKDATATSVIWRQFLADVWERADYFVEITGLQPRPVGTERVIVGLLAESTYDFLVALVALFTLRWQVLLISVRNSPDAILHLTRHTGCKAVLVDAAISHLHTEILRPDTATGVTPAVIARTPVSTNSARDGIARAAAFLKASAEISAADLKKEAEGGAFFLHTSGSTGHPKPIAWSHEFVLALSAANGRDRARCADDVLYTCFPMFHAGGICTSFPFFLGSGASFACLDSWRSVSVDTILRHLRILKREGRKVDASLPPSMLEDIADAADVEGVGILAAQNTVFWGGAPLRENAGNYLVKNGVRLVAWGGSTEAGPLARSSFEEGANPMDWRYMRLVDYYKFHWYPMKGDPHERYNLIVSPIYATPPIVNSLDPLGFATVDGWQRHPDPSKPHMWKPAGRLDDVTVLSNGEKTDNKQLEELLCASRYIYHAIIFGAGRFVNGAVIEPPAGLLKDSSDAAVEKYLDTIWPHIEGHVNKIVPQHSRLLRGMVLVARPDRPFLVSDKGTVKTKASLALYSDDIDRAYEALERGVSMSSSSLPSLALVDGIPAPQDEARVLAFIRALICDTIGRSIGPTDDFFRHGLDSLGATRVRTSLSAALRHASVPAALPRNAVYAHPTCEALARYLCNFVCTAEQPEAAKGQSAKADVPAAEIERLVTKYTKNLPKHRGGRPRTDDGEVYVVTGTTGSLGAAFVAHLLAQENVKRVYLLNRGHATRSMSSRQEASFRDKGLDCAALHQAVAERRVKFVKIDVSKDKLGLKPKTYKKLAFEATHIVHNAWLLNFNLFLSSFEQHIAGVRALLDLALASPYATPPHVAFVSSIGAVARWPFAERPVPEVALNSPEFSLPQGYAYSKYAAEQILQRVGALRPTLLITVVRCGQLSGVHGTGAWARSEYAPRLLRSANALGIIPTGIKPVRWLPVDVAAGILFREVEHAATQRGPRPLLYYSLDNALETPWTRVATALQMLQPGRSMREVPLREFLDAVRKDPRNAAYEVADVLEDLLVTSPVPPLATFHARAAAGNLVDCELSGELLSSYVRYACA